MTDNLPSLIPSQNEMNSFQLIARTAQASGLYSTVGGESKILMIMLAARELGISPIIALNGGIWNIQGKIEISSRLMNSMIRKAGHSIKIVESTTSKCVLLGRRSDGDTYEAIFTIEEAAQAGLAGRDVWKKYTSDMLYNRCMSRLARRLFPDVIGNAYIEGEIREAKEVEELQRAECQDVTPSAHSQPTMTLSEPEPEPPISESELAVLQELFLQTDEDFKTKFDAHMKNMWNANDLCEIPSGAFLVAKVGMERNIEKNKPKAETTA